ncbi:hypothetical protein RJ639_000887 [Escallonia herrerae]|uniref:Peroxidase n=1 Tax=Escallonia herrerae TaxID=1293975 RepID=A0AA88XQG2_9ASTE|nr:hypothetical protein RJ639_000887 [Escallonia herrerae]
MSMRRLFVLGVLVSVIVTLASLNVSDDPDDDVTDSDMVYEFDEGLLVERGSIEEADGSVQYDFYRDTCPEAGAIVWRTMKQIVFDHKNSTAQLLRLLFHDCFIEGCDASILLDDSSGNRSAERQAIPNKTLKGFNFIDAIKEELEKACPGVVSCADIVVLATRDGIALSGGPFFPVLTGRRDGIQSFFDKAMAEIPRPDGNISETLRLFALRGFSERETVALLGGHNIGHFSCEFIQTRLSNFMGTGQPDTTIPSDFLEVMRRTCSERNISSADDGGDAPSPMRARRLREFTKSMTYQDLSTSISSGPGFDAHYYQSLLRGRGLLFSDQQLMAYNKTAEVVKEYGLDDGKTFRLDFARAMIKLSAFGVLTGSRGEVRLTCSMLN